VVATYWCGPSGGLGGNSFYDEYPPDGAFVLQINVWSGSYIDAIQLVYNNGSMTPKHGGSGGTLTTWGPWLPGERLIELSGRYGDYIDSLSITTVLYPGAPPRTYKTLGGSGGSIPFKYSVPQNMEIAGLLGASGSYVDALGIFLRVSPLS
jgi:Jacalin-like lectin domain